MATVTKTLTACMTLGTFAQSDIASFPVTNDLFSNASQKLPVVVPHITRFPNTVLVFRSRPFQKIPGRFRLVFRNL
jgi:hypothetical protein